MRENDFIKRIRSSVEPSKNPLVKGIGDDCAVIPLDKSRHTLLTTDAFVEGVHFKRAYFRPEQIGEKAMAVNISDICAMGGMPKYALVTIGFPKKEKQAFIDRVYCGIIGAAKRFNADIVGGDTVSSPSLFISITVWGEAEKREIMMRSGARPGDGLFVTGFLGSSAAGLDFLKRLKARATGAKELLAVNSHLQPQPRLREGRLLAKSGIVTACIDVSDGLVNDTMRICGESGTGAVIYAENLPVCASTQAIASRFGKDPVDYALYGGEDFELLFTVGKKDIGRLVKLARARSVPVFRAGVITAGKSVLIERNGRKSRPAEGAIWNHF